MKMEGYIIKQLDIDIWEIISPKGELYHVWIDANGIFKCTCPHHVYHKGKVECKHIKLVRKRYLRE